MNGLFQTKHDLISELTKLENIMPEYAEWMHKLGKLIRNKIWDVSNSEDLATVLHACNSVFGLMIDAIGEDISIVEMYVMYLQKHANQYSRMNIGTLYAPLLEELKIEITREIIIDQWRQLNPYFQKEYSKDELYDKGLIEILDDFYSTSMTICPEAFVRTMSDKKFAYLSRGRKGTFSQKRDLAAPPLSVAKKYNIINRWNPSDKRYLYLVAGEGSDNDTETALAEMRIESDEIVTLAEFDYVLEPDNAKIIDFDYEGISRKSIFNDVELGNRAIADEIINKINDGTLECTKEAIENELLQHHQELRKAAAIFAGRVLLKEIVEVIFVPLDSNEDTDNDKKEKCYKSFHLLAEYFENKGFDGICYPSTRMKLLGKHGRNLVLFNADSAEANETTFRIITR